MNVGSPFGMLPSLLCIGDVTSAGMQITKELAGPSALARLGCKPLLLAVDPTSQRLLRYQELNSWTR